MKKILLLLSMVLLSQLAVADWFFRGTANDWTSTPLTDNGDGTFSTCQPFSSGDSGGGPRFKIDRYGDWLENYPASDVAVSNNTTISITFNSTSHAITTTPVSNCDAIVTEDSWFFRGTANGWAATPMNSLGNNLYQLEVTFNGEDANPRFKIDHFADWSENYPAQDYVVNDLTTYDIRFNANTFTVTATEVDGVDVQAPQSQASPAAGTYSTDQTVSLSVSDNQDTQPILHFTTDGSAVTESSPIYNGETILVSDIVNDGIDLTIQTLSIDASGNQQVQTFDYIIEPAPVDNWYFRGTANGWSASEMAYVGNDIYVLDVTFNGEDSNARFKIDHFADWTENYPSQDVIVTDFATYTISFNASSKVITTTPINAQDTQPPSVMSTPNAGIFATPQIVQFTITDNQDISPKLYYTLDGSEPTVNASLYAGEAITVNDIVDPGVDLTIRTLAIDEKGNEAKQQFEYTIDPDQTAAVDFREETIYFLMTARFYDGDASNNYYNRDRIELGDPQWRGDFKGLIAQLDYIKDLGFTAIWVTPPVENRSGLDYHGYHAYDWFTVDPRLESDGGTYQDFINAAHALGLKVVQDVVINHSSQYGIRDEVWIDHLPIKYYVEAGTEQGDMVNDPYFGNLGDYQRANRDDNDNSVAPAWFRERHNSDPDGIVPLVDPKTGITVPLAGYDANRFFGIDANTLDPNWYHLDGFMAGGDWENPDSLQRKHMAGDTIDLATENQNVKDYMNSAIEMYLDMGVDAIRLDTAKHVERDELLSYVHHWQAHKSGTFVFGEVLVKGLGFGSEIANDNGPAEIRPWWYTRTGQDPSNPSGDSNLSVFDFPLFSTFRDNVTKGSLSGIGGALAMDWTYADPTELVTFFQNHDVGPDNDFKYRYGGEQANAALAYNVLWTIRGIPTLYYGEEVMFQAGMPQDIQSNNDVISDTGRAYFGPVLDNKTQAQNHELYQHIKRLNQIRSAVPALQKGVMENVSEWGSGMSFVRNYNQGESYAVVGLATGSDSSVSVSGVRNGTYRDAVTGNTLVVSNGVVSFNVSSYSIGVYVLDGPGKIGTDGTYLR